MRTRYAVPAPSSASVNSGSIRYGPSAWLCCGSPLGRCTRARCGSSAALMHGASGDAVDVLVQQVDRHVIAVRLVGVEVADRDQAAELLGGVKDGQVPDAAHIHAHARLLDVCVETGEADVP